MEEIQIQEVPQQAQPVVNSKTQKPQRKIIQGDGVIKSILSPSSVLIAGPSKGGPPPEIIVLFESVDTPRMRGRSPFDIWAYEFREILRKKCIGKKCHFITTQDVNRQGEDPSSSTKRRFGRVILDDGKEDLTKFLVLNGMAIVRDPKIDIQRLPEDSRAYFNQLKDLQEQARDKNYRLHNPAARPEYTETETDLDVNTFFSQNQGKIVPAVVEYVVSSSYLRVSVRVDDKIYQLALQLSHVQTPEYRRQAPQESSEQIHPPFAEESRFFVERELLQRDVELTLDRITPGSRISARIQAPKGDLGEVLLKLGYGRLVGIQQKGTGNGDLPPDVADRYRQAQEQAQNERLRIWKDYQPRPINASAELAKAEIPENFFALVAEVPQADTLVIIPIRTYIE
ncbi:MAG: putative CRE-TSN-1 protein, partial [Streblomastix strix]